MSEPIPISNVFEKLVKFILITKRQTWLRCNKWYVKVIKVRNNFWPVTIKQATTMPKQHKFFLLRMWLVFLLYPNYILSRKKKQWNVIQTQLQNMLWKKIRRQADRAKKKTRTFTNQIFQFHFNYGVTAKNVLVKTEAILNILQSW